MVLLLYLWENVKKWTSAEEMRGEAHHYYGDGKPAYTTDQDFQQMGGLRRLDQAGVRTHFYPEGGWGWIVCACAFLAHVTTSGAQLSAGALHIVLSNKFQDSSAHHWLGPLSWSVSSVCSPLVFNLCRRKNVRILSLVGGFLFPLSLLFTSFATELHQIFFSFGLIGGIGSCIVRESSGVVLGEYFRRRRQFVEQVVMAGTGVGVTLFSLLYLSFSRHLEWSQGFRVGAALSTICVMLPAFYRTANMYNPNRAQLKNQRQPASPKSQRVSSILVPLGGDICHSLNLFCVPALKPVLWSASISSFGLYAPVFLMSDFGRSEGLSGGSLLLLQTHLGLGLSLGVILGAILTLKKFHCCHVSPRMLCCVTCVLTGLSMIAISSVKGYYGYSLSAWIYGIALGAHLYTLKVLLMELTRTKHWGRVWSCVQSLMSPGILIGSGVTSYLGKPGFYACATCVLIGAGLIGFQLIDLTKCGSPQLSSSLDNDSPIPPAPPPISPTKYGTPTALAHGHGGMGGGAAVVGPNQMIVPPGASGYPLRRSISLQQPLYPCCRGESAAGDYPPVPGGGQPPGGGAPYTPVLGMHHGGSGGGGMYSPYCRECLMTPPPYGPTPPPMFPQMIRSYSLPQTAPLSDSSVNLRQKTTGTQTNPNSPVNSPSPMGVTYRAMNIPYPGGSFDRIHAAASAVVTSRGFVLPEDRVLRDPPSSLHTTPKAAARGAPVSALVSKPSTPSAILQPGTDSLRRFQPGYKSSVMFASNPQLFPASSSATSTTEERSSSRGFDNSATPTPTPQQNQNASHAMQNGNGGHRYLVNNHHHHNHHVHTSSRDYYPQREERRATFLRHQQQHPQQFPQDRSFDSQKSAESSIFPAPHMQPQPQPAQHPHPHPHQQHPMTPQGGRFSVSVEQHKRPTPHKKSQESIANGTGGPGSSPKPPLPKNQKPSSAHEKPAFTRHYFDSSKILPATKRKMIQHQHAAKRDQTPTISAQVHQKDRQERQRQPQQPHYYPRWTQPQVPVAVARQFDPFADDPDPPYYPAALSHAQTHAYHRGGTPVKISSAEFNIEPPKFNSLRRPGTAGSGSIGGGGDTTRGSSISSQLNLATSGVYGGVPLHQQPQHHHMLHQQPQPLPLPPPHHHQPYLPPAPPIHPAYTPSRAQHYHPGAVPVYPPLAPQPLHGHHPPPPPHHQTPSRHLPPHHHPQPQQHHPSTPKNVSSATNDPPPPNYTTNKVPPPSQQSQQQENEIETQQSRNQNQKSLLEASSRTSQAKKSDKGFLVVKSDDDVEDVIDGDGDDNDNDNSHDNYNNAATVNSRDDDDDHDFLECDNDIDANDADDDDDDEMIMTSSSSRDNFLGGPTIINLPPTIISGASPCPYCDVRRPQSSLSEIPGGASRTFPSGSGGPGSTASGGCGGGAKRYFRHRFHRHMMNHVGHLNRRLVPGYSLSLSVPALQQIYGSTTRHLYCSPGRGQAPSQCYGLYGNIAKSKDFANFHFAPIQFPTPKSTPKSAQNQSQGAAGGRQGPPPLLRRNTWHVPKDFLEQITTSV